MLDKLFSLFDGISCVSVGLTFIATLLLAWNFLKAPKNIPPGPWGIPFLGYWPFLGKVPHETLAELAKKYGEIFSIRIGTQLVVVLSSFESIKQAFVKQSENFAGRPFSLSRRQEHPTIFASESETWRDYKRFSLSTLRDFGIGKLSLEPRVKEEIEFLLKAIETYKGQSADIGDLIRMSVSNVICSIQFGKRYDYEDKEFQYLMKILNDHISRTGLNNITGIIPQIFANNFLTRLLLYKHSTLITLNKLLKIIRQKIFTLDKNHVFGSEDNFISAWLTEAKSRTNNKNFSNEHLARVVFSLFVAGSDTTANSLRWSLLYLMKYPDIQARIHKEIDEVIGKERMPSITDRDLMPYTEATINELQRITSLVPLSINHSNFNETELLGFKIPKRTTIIPNLWAVHHDPKLYPEPHVLKPERFLNESGKLIKEEKLIPFSMGKRQCMGEALARMELFLYFTSLYQKFEFQKPDDEGLTFDYMKATVLAPMPFKVCAKLRI